MIRIFKHMTPKLWIISIGFVLLCTLSFTSTANLQARDPNRQLVQTSPTQPTGVRRIALVMGNGAYTNAPPLKNPPNDARDMAATLKALGFEVTSGINVNQREMKRLMREFGQKLKAGGNGLFYYAGHGVQSKGRNYLIPVEADIQSEIEAEDAGVDVSLVLGYMDDAQNGLNIVILDACRNNPFARSFRSAASGLAQVDAPTGTLIAYATAPGRVASDGTGQNGLYTSELLKQMLVPGLSATELFMRVRAEVMKETSNKQVPWEASSLVGSFYFSGSPTNLSSSNNNTSSNTPPSETKFDAAAFEYNYWDSIKNSTSADDFKAYLAKYPNGQFADLAKNRIKGLEVSTKPLDSQPSSGNSAAEIAFWDSVKNSTSADDYRAYLEKYPNGEFARLAKNRLVPLEAAISEKEKAEETKRLEAEAARPLKTFSVLTVFKGGFAVGDYTTPAKLVILRSRFRVDYEEQVTVNGKPYEFSEAARKKADEDWNCGAFQSARADSVWIREIRFQGLAFRIRFQSPAEASDALTEIQRVCKTNP